MSVSAVPVYLTNPPVMRSGNGPAAPRGPACYANASATPATLALFLNTTASNYGTAPGSLTMSSIATTPFELIGLVNTTVSSCDRRQLTRLPDCLQCPSHERERSSCVRA
jgi:hypothetical protein